MRWCDGETVRSARVRRSNSHCFQRLVLVDAVVEREPIRLQTRDFIHLTALVAGALSVLAQQLKEGRLRRTRLWRGKSAHGVEFIHLIGQFCINQVRNALVCKQHGTLQVQVKNRKNQQISRIFSSFFSFVLIVLKFRFEKRTASRRLV
jgi:hypothetical protein